VHIQEFFLTRSSCIEVNASVAELPLKITMAPQAAWKWQVVTRTRACAAASWLSNIVALAHSRAPLQMAVTMDQRLFAAAAAAASAAAHCRISFSFHP